MTRGRKRKMSDKQEEFLLDMKGFVTTLAGMQTLLKKACGLDVTLPTIRAYFIKHLGDKGYKKLIYEWKIIRGEATKIKR